MNEKATIGILLGDGAGVGPEIVAKLAVDSFFEKHCRPVLIGDERVLKKELAIMGKQLKYKVVSDLQELEDEGIFLLDTKDLDPNEIKIGQVNMICGMSSLRMMVTASNLCKEGLLDGFCYAPFNKASLIEAGNSFESEIHFIANEFGDKEVGEINVLDDIWSSRVTSHVPLKDVSSHLSVNKIVSVIQFIHNIQEDIGISPVIGVAALNPHAGENGHCGMEEIEIITPAIELARQKGMNVKGPYPSDILFLKAFDGDFNSVVTMYHDQGQIAMKLKGFSEGITIGGGLSYPVGTCAHGTAFDIAGKGIATVTSFQNAVKTVSMMAMRKKGN